MHLIIAIKTISNRKVVAILFIFWILICIISPDDEHLKSFETAKLIGFFIDHMPYTNTHTHTLSIQVTGIHLTNKQRPNGNRKRKCGKWVQNKFKRFCRKLFNQISGTQKTLKNLENDRALTSKMMSDCWEHHKYY